MSDSRMSDSRMSEPVWPVMLQMMQERVAEGQRQYGRPLSTHNQRRAMRDLWEELFFCVDVPDAVDDGG